MGKTFPEIDDKLRAWIEGQKMFFVATAPLTAEGLVNCSPKGLDSFRILGPTRVAYLDLTGSGIETIAHLRENGRLTIMFCAFDGGPRIVRLQGRGSVHELGTPEFDKLLGEHFTPITGMRAIIVLEARRISDSCGFGVPLYDYRGDRETLIKYSEKEGPEGLETYRQTKNSRSLDGLPGWRAGAAQEDGAGHGA